MKYLICFLSLQLIRESGGGWLNQARQRFPDHEVIVVADDGDRLLYDPAIRGFLTKAGVTNLCQVHDFIWLENHDHVIVTNGGSETAKFSIFGRLITSQTYVEVYEFHTNGCAKKVWPEDKAQSLG